MGKEANFTGTFAGGQWRPKYPEAAVGRRAPLRREDPDQSQLVWAMAPDSSHVMKFRYQDARRFRFEGHNRSILSVWFKATKTRPATGYRYFFSDHEEGKRVFEALIAAGRPGVIVDRRLIKAGIPYEATAMGDEDLSGTVHLQPDELPNEDVFDLSGSEDEVVDLAGYEDESGNFSLDNAERQRLIRQILGND